jgi:hypothetical protein
LRSQVKDPRRSLRYATPPYGHAPIYQLSFTYLERQKCYGPEKKILLKKKLFDFEVMTLRSKIKVPWRSLWYTTHRLMVMHPYTKYHWPISKDKNVMARTRKYHLIFFIWPWVQRSRSHKGNYVTRDTALWSCTQTPNTIDLSPKIKMLWPGQENTI